jgi:hypothetical protein
MATTDDLAPMPTPDEMRQSWRDIVHRQEQRITELEACVARMQRYERARSRYLTGDPMTEADWLELERAAHDIRQHGDLSVMRD